VVSHYNTIQGNRIEFNGRSGAGIGIDLGGSQTQLANDVGDADAGANMLQNSPAITSSTIFEINFAENYEVRDIFATINTVPNVPLSVDYYFSTSCTSDTGANGSILVAGDSIMSSGAAGIVVSGATYTDMGPGFLTATATTYPAGTSELSPCWPTDRILQSRNEEDGI